MLISDLFYFKNISGNAPIKGTGLLSIDAAASATGNTSLVLTDTGTNIKEIANGRGAIAQGKGSALAIGEDPYAEIDFYANEFDKVKVIERSRQRPRFAYSRLYILAIDLPN